MRFNAIALLASAAVLAACGGDKNAQSDSAGSTAAAAAPAAAPAAGATTAAAPATTPAAGAPAPITGKTVEVKMIGDDKGYRFEPNNITIKQGDGIKFIMTSGGPHNVAFDPATVPAAAKTALSANMGPNQIGELSGPLVSAPNEAYTISFANVPAGKYDFHCTPHLAMGMKGTITVQ